MTNVANTAERIGNVQEITHHLLQLIPCRSCPMPVKLGPPLVNLGNRVSNTHIWVTTRLEDREFDSEDPGGKPSKPTRDHPSRSKDYRVMKGLESLLNSFFHARPVQCNACQCKYPVVFTILQACEILGSGVCPITISCW
jgi:hypothetical protein